MPLNPYFNIFVLLPCYYNYFSDNDRSPPVRVPIAMDRSSAKMGPASFPGAVSGLYWLQLMQSMYTVHKYMFYNSILYITCLNMCTCRFVSCFITKLYAEKDKLKSTVSDASRSTFIPPAPEVVFRSEWGKGLDQAVDDQDVLMDQMVNEMADSQEDLKIRKHYLSDAQREEMQKRTPR